MGVALLGVDPESADEELGYIVPGRPCSAGIRHVARFVEKPSASTAQSLIAEGALWNVFILTARARALLELIDRSCPGIVAELRHALAQVHDGASAVDRLAAIYERLPELDFSRHVAQPAASSLRVIRAPQCGWSDLGTPKRVADVLNRTVSTKARPVTTSQLPSCISLAEQFARSVAAPMSLSA
jgi:mannose-1-phosphate guanylyltransferase